MLAAKSDGELEKLRGLKWGDIDDEAALLQVRSTEQIHEWAAKERTTNMVRLSRLATAASRDKDCDGPRCACKGLTLRTGLLRERTAHPAGAVKWSAGSGICS